LGQDLTHGLLGKEGVKRLVAPQFLVAKAKDAQAKG
jgi:hypothetical protein